MTDLQDAWADLLRRRPAFRDSLTIYGEILDAWARWSPPRPLALSPDAAGWRAAWERGTPLVEHAAATLRPADVEELVGGAMEILARAEPTLGAGLQRLAEAWDRGAVGPVAFLPARGRIGSGAVEQASGLAGDVVAFLAGASLRPALQAVFAPAREELDEGSWSL